MSKTRDNHFVPQWYQRGFFDARENELCYLTERHIEIPGQDKKIIPSRRWYTPVQQFKKYDLYSTFFGENLNDDIERKLFGAIDGIGSKAIRAFSSDDVSQWHENFQNFFTYIDAQKLRTPKGLDWIKTKYPKLSQAELMSEMQYLRMIHCTIWAEGVREFVSAEESNVKFITSDHPVTIYNHACPPDSSQCQYPNDPDILLKGSQTIFPLNKDRCLILTNLEYAKDPANTNPLEQRTNPARVRQGLVNTIEFINSRRLTEEDVAKINFVIKSRAQSSIAGGKEEWLYPERRMNCSWSEIRSVLLPPKSEIYRYGGEIFAKFADGSVHYQDAYGRTTPDDTYLGKAIDEKTLGRNDLCGCGSGRKYKRCCAGVPADLRTDWSTLSIRERNLAFCNCIRDILGLDKGLQWIDVQKNLSDTQIKEIYSYYDFLWPKDTNIYTLLPKPDAKFRGLYSGAVDIRTIMHHVLPMASMFDEFLIATPIVNPKMVRPEFSPIENPGKYKYQALKDFLFMLTLEPFIARGLVNLIPDPTDLDINLLRAVLDMAKARSGSFSEKLLCKEEMVLHQRLLLEDMYNAMALMPEDSVEKLFAHQFHFSEDAAAKISAGMRAYTEHSPLRLLQTVPADKAGQFMQFRFAPNYEMSLLIAKVTGSVISTNSKTRWLEFERAKHRAQGVVNYPWSAFNDQITQIPIDHGMLMHYRKTDEKFSSTRELLKSADRMVIENNQDALRIAALESKAINHAEELCQSMSADSTQKIRISSPEGGFYDTNVHRLLARSSCTNYGQNVRSVIGFGIDA